MLKVLITTVPFGKYNASILDEMKSAGLEFVVNPLARRLKEDELADMISDFDILIAGTEPITARVMSRASNLKLISRVGIGLDNVDLNAAKLNRILVSYTPNAPTEAVAELTIGSIFSLLRDTHIANLQMHKRIWERRFGRRLGDVSIGILGLGRIGTSVLRLLLNIGSTSIMVNDVDTSLKQKLPENVIWASKDQIYENCDVISLHLPLTKKTKNLITQSELKKMKSGVLLVNTSRSGIINENNLISALENGHVSGAAIDVFDEEPYYGRLCEIENCLLTAHMGSMSIDCRSRMETEAVEEAIRFSKAQPLCSEVPEFEYENQCEGKN